MRKKAASGKQPVLPPGLARRVGYMAGKRPLHPILTAEGFVPQPEPQIGVVLEIYDVLSWGIVWRGQVHRSTPERDVQYLKGYAQALGGRIGQQVHLVLVDDRGNGHNDYEIVAGPLVKPEKKGTPSQRRMYYRRQKRGARKFWWPIRQVVLMSKMLPRGVSESDLHTFAEPYFAEGKCHYLPGWTLRKVVEAFLKELQKKELQ